MQKENLILRVMVVVLSVSALSILALWNRKDMELRQYQSSKAITQAQYDSLLQENKNLSDFNDSVRTELFIERNNVGRYEMGLDFLKERRPNEYNLVMHYIATQTE